MTQHHTLKRLGKSPFSRAACAVATLALAACGSGEDAARIVADGGPESPATLDGDTATSDAGVAQEPDAAGAVDAGVLVAESLLLVANLGDNTILRFRTGDALSAATAPLGVIAGGQTRLSMPTSLQSDAIGGLLVTSYANSRILGFSNALAAAGDLLPERYVGGVASGLNGPSAAAYARDQQALFVANMDDAPGSVVVFEGVNTPDFTGEVAPVRVLRSNDIDNARDLELSPRGELYVVNSGFVSVFEGASTAQGEVAASRVIRSRAFDGRVLMDGVLGEGDWLYLAAGDQVLQFAGAGQLDGDVEPTRVISVAGATQLGGLALDAQGTLYVSDTPNNCIYTYHGLPGREFQGMATAADLELRGPDTRLASPARLLLLGEPNDRKPNKP